MLSVLYVVVALINTWLAADFSVMSKLTASALLILPWTMLLVGATYGESLHGVARVLLACGLLSAIYALLQIALGPTVVEVRWADAAGSFSISAGRLASFLGGTSTQESIWRVNGFQPDALTFGLLMITALASCWVLKCERKLRAGLAWSASSILLAGTAICLVRTIWVSFLAFALFGCLAYRARVLLRPKVFVLTLVGIFVLSDYSSTYLRDQALMVARVDNIYIARAMVLGTVAARKDSLQNFAELVPERLLQGSGYAASSWVGGKFDEDQDRQKNLAASTSHNVILELLWYVGLPGLLLFVLLLYEISRCAFVTVARAAPARSKTLLVLAGYVVGMFVSGLGNGGVFLGFYFFFFAGTIVAQGIAVQKLRRCVAQDGRLECR